MPRYVHLEERRAGEQSFTALSTFVLDATADCAGIVNCEQVTLEEVWGEFNRSETRFYDGICFFLQTVSHGLLIVFGPGTFSEASARTIILS